MLTQGSPWRVELRALLLLAVPLALSRVAQMTMGVVDTLMAGSLGPGAVAALGLANNVYFLCTIWAFGLVLGSDPFVSQNVGAGNIERSRQGLIVARRVGLLTGFPILIWSLVAPVILTAMGQEPTLVDETAAYLTIIGAGSFLHMLGFAMQTYLSAHGITWPGLVITLVANFVNIAGNYAFIHGIGPLPELGVQGIALSTVVGHGFEVAAMLALFAWHPACRAVAAPWVRPEPGVTREILTIGMPVAVQYALEVAAFSIGSITMGLFGTHVMAGHSVAINTVSMTFMAAIGISAAGSIRVGNACGRGDIEGVVVAGRVAWSVGLALAAFWAVLLALFATPIARWYLDEPATLAAAASFMTIASVFQLADTTQGIGFGLLRGMKDTRVPVWFNVVGYWLLGLPAALVMAFVVTDDPRWIWWGWTLGLWCIGLMTLGRFAQNVRRMRAVGSTALEPALEAASAG